MFFLLRQSPQILIYCVLTAAFSGPGQTYLISLFIPEIEKEFHLSRGLHGVIFSVATIASAFFFPICGRLLDTVPVAFFTFAMTASLALGCVLLGVSKNIILLLFSFFVIRTVAQAAFPLCAGTTASRRFTTIRGRALAITGLGFALGEAVFPGLMAFLMHTLGWREASISLGLMTLVFYLPASLWLLKSDLKQNGPMHMGNVDTPDISKATAPDMKKILRDWRFHVLLFGGLITSFMVTGLFYHQGSINERLGWSPAIFPVSMSVFAVVRAAFSWVTGSYVDTHSSRSLFGYHLLPLVAAMICLGIGTDSSTAFIYMALVGVSVGLSGIVRTSLWTEMYGLKHLGSINGVVGFVVILGTAIAPPLFGYLLDHGYSLRSIMFVSAAITAVTAVLGRIACKHPAKHHADHGHHHYGGHHKKAS